MIWDQFTQPCSQPSNGFCTGRTNGRNLFSQQFNNLIPETAAFIIVITLIIIIKGISIIFWARGQAARELGRGKHFPRSLGQKKPPALYYNRNLSKKCFNLFCNVFGITFVKEKKRTKEERKTERKKIFANLRMWLR